MSSFCDLMRNFTFYCPKIVKVKKRNRKVVITLACANFGQIIFKNLLTHEKLAEMINKAFYQNFPGWLSIKVVP